MWSETSKIELKLPNDMTQAHLEINRADAFRTFIYIIGQSTGYNLNIQEEARNPVGWKPS